MALSDFDLRPGISALLGPTNTGKTWRAVQRMLAHRSGMMGLPLRLLARELYDRVTAEVGEASVALVTGEERRVPPRARYWLCTVESMPLDVEVDFIAVDEIQLAAHPERGHVFTDRLLHARGLRETMWMGSDTMAPALQELAPTLEISSHPRFSRLTHTGMLRLEDLPQRCAVVAFSAEKVYLLAEQLRRLRGGTAVVMGALSPRTRNAQVAMYQAGDVHYMVATDAIGMGLNMDVDHVCLADLAKFDGRNMRRLHDAELAQIAGRAGRYTRDGTFGTLDEAGPLMEETIENVEQHRFPAVRRLMWRSSTLDFSSPAALLRSLGARPSRRLFQMVDQAEDVEALRSLLVKPEVRARASDKAHLELLWEVAQVPDFRKLLMDTHVGLLAEVYLYLTGPQGAVPAELVARRIDRIDRVEGDIDTLTTRLAAIRTWTYLSHRRGWLEDAARHQARSREVEDRLSDALHEKLIQRFVDHRSAAIAHALARGALDLEVAADGLVRSGGQLLGALRGLDFEPVLSREKSDARALRKAARQALAPELGRRVVALVEAQHEEIGLDELGRLVWRDGVLGWWEKGEAPGLPLLKLAPLEMLGAGERQRVQRRLVAWSRDAAAEVVERLRRPEAEGLSPGGRGLVYELERRLGLVYRADVADLELVERDRRLLARLDVRLGAHCVYLANQFDPQLTLIRAALAAAWLGLERPPALPAPGQVSLVADGQADFYAAIGYPVVGPRALRVDMLERVAACLREAARRSGSMAFDLPRSLGDWMGCPLSDSIAVARALGWVVDAQGRCSSPDRLRRRAP